MTGHQKYSPQRDNSITFIVNQGNLKTNDCSARILALSIYINTHVCTAADECYTPSENKALW